MTLNTILILVVLAVMFVFIAYMYMRAKGKEDIKYEAQYETLDDVVLAVKQEMVDLVREDTNLTLTNEEADRLYNRKKRINEALKKCVYGIDAPKSIVIDLITDFIEREVPDESVRNILGLNFEEGGEPSNAVMFEIIMLRYTKRYGKDALDKWIKKNDFDRERPALNTDDIHQYQYYISVEDLQRSYADEAIELTEREMREVLAIIVYQCYKGFGCIDTIRSMNINGLSLGVSGSVLESAGQKANVARATQSAWLYYAGKEIHLQFVDFGSEDELRRIIQLICRWNSPGALTAKRGGLVNTMADKSRVLALRPPAAEYWAVFIRKFSLGVVSPEDLICKPYIKDNTGMLAVNLIKFLMKGEVTSAVTGRQGSGKTTMMTAIIKYIDPRYTLRVLEMAPELYLRELYPERNILSLQETTTVTPEMEQDWLKKSNGVVSLVGEVATDNVAMNMIQMGMTASKFTIFSHHGNTPKDLVLTLRNSLVNAGGFSNMETAEKQVTDVVRVDIHLETTAGGKRYIQRISEIVQLNSATQYPELDRRDLEFSKAQVEREYYYRQTDRISFTSREILAYDLDTDTYYTKERFSPKTEDYMKSKMDPETRLAFESFLLENWGLPPEVKETLENPEGDLDKAMKELNLTGTFGDSLRDNIKAYIDTGLSPDDAIKAATNATLGKAKDDIKIGDEKIIENNSKYAWEKPKEQQEIDLSSEFNIGDMGLFDDDF
mgnify:CR=1 FL=1|jgi:pilus assembly protein CpaF